MNKAELILAVQKLLGKDVSKAQTEKSINSSSYNRIPELERHFIKTLQYELEHADFFL